MIEKIIYISILAACVTEFILFVLGFAEYTPNIEYKAIFDFVGKRLNKFKDNLCPFCLSVWITWILYLSIGFYQNWNFDSVTISGFFIAPVLELQILRILRSIDYF